MVRREEEQRRVNDIAQVRVVGRTTAEQGGGHDEKPTGWRTGQEAEQDGWHCKRAKAEWNARARAGNGMSRQGRAGQGTICMAWAGQGRAGQGGDTPRKGQGQRQIQSRAVQGRGSGRSSSRGKDRGSDRAAARAGQEQNRA